MTDTTAAEDRIEILAVDDSLTTLRLTQLLLEDVEAGEAEGVAKCHVDAARDLAEAREKLSAKAYDLVLVDLGLPDSHGGTTFRSIKELSGDAAIVVVTGDDDPALAVQLTKEGATDYVIKGTLDIKSLATRVLVWRARNRTPKEGNGPDQPAELPG